MKISKSQLKKVIQEEISNVINEGFQDNAARGAAIEKHLDNVFGDANDVAALKSLGLLSKDRNGKADFAMRVMQRIFPTLGIRPDHILRMITGAEKEKLDALEKASSGVSFQGGPERTTMRGAQAAQLGALARGSDIATRRRPQTKPSNPLTNT